MIGTQMRVAPIAWKVWISRLSRDFAVVVLVSAGQYDYLEACAPWKNLQLAKILMVRVQDTHSQSWKSVTATRYSNEALHHESYEQAALWQHMECTKFVCQVSTLNALKVAHLAVSCHSSSQYTTTAQPPPIQANCLPCLGTRFAREASQWRHIQKCQKQYWSKDTVGQPSSAPAWRAAHYRENLRSAIHRFKARTWCLPSASVTVPSEHGTCPDSKWRWKERLTFQVKGLAGGRRGKPNSSNSPSSACGSANSGRRTLVLHNFTLWDAQGWGMRPAKY